MANITDPTAQRTPETHTGQDPAPVGTAGVVSSAMSNFAARLTEHADAHLAEVDKWVRGPWSRPITWRQPVHTLYMPADKFFAQLSDGASADSSNPIAEYVKLARQQARAALGEHDSFRAGIEELGKTVGLEPQASADVAALVEHKLATQPIEDLRIDLEDGFTQRAVPDEDRDADEDVYALRAADALALWALTEDESLPSFAGIRFKSFDPLTRARGIRTLTLVLARLHERGALEHLYGPNADESRQRALRLTFPKVQSHHQVEVLVELLQLIENQYGLPEGCAIRFEIQVETPQSIVGINGESEAVRLMTAAGSRCLSLHYGTYDYSAFLGVDAAYQSMEHPVADFAKDTLQVACSAVGVELSDGSTNRIPVGDAESMRAAWALHFRLVQRHLARGIRQGWDLHPAQLLTRHLATIAYFRDQWEQSAERLRDYVAGDQSRWMDEPATAKAMSSYLRRAYQAGAVTSDDLAAYNLDFSTLENLQVTGRLSTN